MPEIDCKQSLYFPSLILIRAPEKKGAIETYLIERAKEARTQKKNRAKWKEWKMSEIVKHI